MRVGVDSRNWVFECFCLIFKFFEGLGGKGRKREKEKTKGSRKKRVN